MKQILLILFFVTSLFAQSWDITVFPAEVPTATFSSEEAPETSGSFTANIDVLPIQVSGAFNSEAPYDSILVGDTLHVTWSSQDLLSPTGTQLPISIQLSRNDQQSWTTLSNSVVDTFYHWLVTGTETADSCYLRLFVAGYNIDTLKSNVFKIKYNAPVVIHAHPRDTTVFNQQQARFTVNAEGENLTYQWRRNNTPISNSNNDTLLVTADLTNSGYYNCAIWSTFGDTAYSDNALLRVKPRVPVVTVQPVSDTTTGPVTFSVTATGDSLQYAWYRQGVYTGSNTAIYQFTANRLMDNDSLQAVIWNSSDTIGSGVVHLTVVYAIFDSVNRADSNRIYIHGNFLSGTGWTATLSDSTLITESGNATNQVFLYNHKLLLTENRYELVITNGDYPITLNIGHIKSKIGNLINRVKARIRAGF